MVSGHKVSESFLIKCANWLGQVPERSGVGQVQYFRVVVLYHPREHGILGQVQRAPLRIRVQNLEVLKVAYLTLAPLIGVDLNVCRLGLACARQVLLHALIDLVSLLLTLEAEQQSSLLRLPRHPVHLDQFELKADLQQLEATVEKLSEVSYLVVDDLFVV